MSLSDSVARATLSLYSALKFRPANPAQYKILSSFTLVHRSGTIAPISLATGSKCLPATRLSANGDAVHDSHAEVLSRRGAIRWFMEEICRSTEKSSLWVERREAGKWALKTGVSVHIRVAEEGGDASMRTLAATPQDPAIAALKSASPLPVPEGNGAARGRDNYSLLGVLRTKPGRADSPPTLSMSCSDKIARWCVLGIQGALASHILDAIYIDEIILGGVDPATEENVREDCERAFWKRTDCSALQTLPSPFTFHPPQISFTLLEFPHGLSRQSLDPRSSSCNESLCWIASSSSRYEVLIHGLRRGVGDKQRTKPHLRPLVSKLALFALYQQTLACLDLTPIQPDATYHDIKQAATAYQTAKSILNAPSRPFAGWIVSGKKWESFTVDGVVATETNL